MLSLAQLTVPQSIQTHFERFQLGLRGIGIPRHFDVNGNRPGVGTGTLRLAGVPKLALAVLVEVVVGGQVGGATWRYSVNSGGTWSAAATTSDTDSAVGSTGLTVAFLDGPDGGGDSFVAGDRFSIALATPGFPTTAWQPFSVPRTLMELNADGDAERDELIARVAAGGYLETATGVWLDFWATSMYGLERVKGRTTVGRLVLADDASVGPLPISAGQLYALSDDGLRFTNTGAWFDGAGVRQTSPAILALDDTLTLEFVAEQKGAAYNVGNATISTLETPIPGVSISNPAQVDTGNWVDSQGTDDETDDSLKDQCRSRWPELSVQPPADVYVAWAKRASSEVTRVFARAHATIPGRVHITLAGPAGGVSGDAVTTVYNYILPKIPLCCTLQVESAATHGVTITATVYVLTAFKAAAEVACPAALNARQRALPIDGPTLYKNQLVEDLMGATVGDTIINVSISAPAVDDTLTPGEVAVFTINLTYSEV